MDKKYTKRKYESIVVLPYTNILYGYTDAFVKLGIEIIIQEKINKK